MSKRIVTVEITRYYSKTGTVSIEVDADMVGDELVDYLTNDDEVDEMLEEALYSASLNGDDTTYEWQDPTNNIGGTL
jgi:hypothetical protein